MDLNTGTILSTPLIDIKHQSDELVKGLNRHLQAILQENGGKDIIMEMTNDVIKTIYSSRDRVLQGIIDAKSSFKDFPESMERGIQRSKMVAKSGLKRQPYLELIQSQGDRYRVDVSSVIQDLKKLTELILQEIENAK